MSEPENLTLVVLREMRTEMNARFDAMQAKNDARFDAIEKQLEQLRANGVKGLAGFVGHRSMTERAFGSVDKQLAAHEARLDALETAR
jgi:hypothetical protein